MFRSDLGAMLRAALAARRIDDLRQLFETHGLVVFSAAVADLRPRAAADVLSLLPPEKRSAVLRRMPSQLRNQLIGGVAPSALHLTSQFVPNGVVA